MARDSFGDSPKFCKHCGSVSPPRIKTVKEGDALTGFLLTLLMILPGLLYFALRMRTEEFWVSGVCGRRGGLIPTDTPIAQAALQSRPTVPEELACISCGKSNESEAAYCSACGQKLQSAISGGPTAEGPSTPIVAVEPNSRYKLLLEDGTESSDTGQGFLRLPAWLLVGIVVGIIIVLIMFIAGHG